MSKFVTCVMSRTQSLRQQTSFEIFQAVRPYVRGSYTLRRRDIWRRTINLTINTSRDITSSSNNKLTQNKTNIWYIRSNLVFINSDFSGQTNSLTSILYVFHTFRHSSHVLLSIKHVMTLYETTSIIFNMKTEVLKLSGRLSEAGETSNKIFRFDKKLIRQ